ncbi:MAG: hypothetical protein DRQ48_01815 [Gammaproteobacteria bacterium]|nr:MAG: hypothetical protein DRQ48_01815 [Gammaproteobacteria bacterium]
MSKDWEEDFGLENGNYSCTCCYCKSQFIGYKRRVVCKECHDEIKATKDSIYNEAEDDVERLEDKLADEQNSLQIALSDVERLEAEVTELKEIVKAVAYIGVDFGYGEFELDNKHIEKARYLMEKN